MLDEIAYLADMKRRQAKSWPKEVPREPAYAFGEIPLHEYLRRWAQRQPERVAYIFYGAELTYRELDEQSDRFAGLLAARGVKRGDRVAVFLPNCPQFAIAFYGILKLGAVHVPVNPLFKEHELLYELNDTGAVAILALDQLFGLVRTVWSKTSLSVAFTTSFADALPAQPTLPVPDSIRQPKQAYSSAEDLMPALAKAPRISAEAGGGLDDVAALNYTGGTTGMPKGCVHTQRDMVYTAATACTIAMGLNSRDVTLCFHPVFWIAGEDLGLIFPVFAGATCVLLARWDPLAFMTAVQRYRVTIASMLIDNAVEVMDRQDAAHYDLRSLRAARCSSFVKKIGIGYCRRWERLTGSTLIEAAWGMTETHTADTFTNGMQTDDMDLKSQPIFVGLPMPGTEFKICDFTTGALKPPGEEGEICVRTPSLLKAYWNKPAETAQALRNGWLYTGDIGAMDEQGYLHFLGRRKEMLKVKGMSVFPSEIEAMLGQHPAIVGSGVIGREDADRGQVPVAFVTVDPAQRASVRAEDLAAWCRERMAVYKVPEIRIVDSLPLTATGKVKKEELSKLL
jgi:acyl-CoA synthetase (AMP-forming)/AMP-acid ligase II